MSRPRGSNLYEMLNRELENRLCITRSHGHAVNVINVVDGKINIEKKKLQAIFSQVPALTEVATIAITGEKRQGKSFLLNFFLQYIEYRSRGNPPARHSIPATAEDIANINHPWLRDLDRNAGFTFRSGMERDTVGILMWSKPLLIEKSDGTKIAIILMDSQGLYDASTDENDNVRLFTIVSLISSSILFNTKSHIDFKKLSELKMFMDYAKTGSKTVTGSKPFQRLTFIIRDYTLAELGWTGGQAELAQFLEPHEKQSSDVRSVAKSLKKGFFVIDAFALPPPGSPVTKERYSGSLSKVDIDFLIQLETIVSDITEGAEAKKQLVLNLTAGEMVSYIQELVQFFNQQTAPDLLMQLNERALIRKAYEAREQLIGEYESGMQEQLNLMPDSYYAMLSESEISETIDQWHREYQKKVVQQFQDTILATLHLYRGSDGKPVSALEDLKAELDKKIHKLRPFLTQLAMHRQKEAILKEQMATATDSEEVAKLEDLLIDHQMEREYLAQEIDTDIVNDVGQRSKGFWEEVANFFKSLYHAIF